MKKLVFAVWGMLAAFPAWAQNQTYGDWVVESPNGELFIAKTSDTKGNVTGVICAAPAGKCVPYIATDKTCTPQSSYTMMINSSVDASSVTGMCEKAGNILLLSFSKSDAAAVISAFESGGGMVGFAFPLKNGEFISYRFSTSGSTQAIAAALSAAQNAAASQETPAKPAASPQVF